MFYLNIVSKLREIFFVGREENCNCRYLALNIQPEKIHTAIDQNNYIEQLKKVDINPVFKFQKKLTLSDSVRETLRARIGQLLWISNHTRPDISSDVSILGSRLIDATINELQAVNKLINEIKDNQYTLSYQPLDLQFKILLFTDAAFGNSSDRGSQGSHVIFLVDQHNKFNLISWQCKHIEHIVHSTLAAETIAMMHGVEPAVYISVLLKELHPQLNNIPIEIYTDSKPLYDALKSQKYVSDKRLRIDIGALKEMLHNKEIDKIH